MSNNVISTSMQCQTMSYQHQCNVKQCHININAMSNSLYKHQCNAKVVSILMECPNNAELTSKSSNKFISTSTLCHTLLHQHQNNVRWSHINTDAMSHNVVGMSNANTVKPVLKGYQREGQKRLLKTGNPLIQVHLHCILIQGTQKRWQLKTGAPLIEVTTWAGLPVYQW